MKKKILFVLRACIAAPIHYMMMIRSFMSGGLRFSFFSLFMTVFMSPLYIIGSIITTIGGSIVAFVAVVDKTLSGKFEKQFALQNAAYNKYVKSPLFKKLKSFLHGKEIK